MLNPRETTLMVVEDDFLIAMGMEMALQAAGYIVREPLPSVEAALAAVAAQPADLALLDVNLAGQQVFPVADALAARHLPFIFLTGCDEAVLPPRFAGSAILVKPVSADKMLTAIGQVLDQGAAPVSQQPCG